jgi:phage-related minor tail protein
VINRTAREIVGLSNAEAELGDRLKLVDALLIKTALSAEEAALASRKLRIEAQGAFLSGLGGGTFPLLEATQKLNEQMLFLDMNQERLAASGISYEEAQKRMARQAFGLSDTIDQLNEKQEALVKNQELLGLSAAELEVELRKLNIQFLQNQRDAGSGASLALERYIDDVTNAAAFTEMVFSDAFKGIEDAIVGFVETGKFQIDDLFRNFAAQLIRLGAQQATAGFGSVLGGLFGGGTTGATGGSAGGGFGGLIASAAGSFFGFQNGGAFTVGANTAVQGLPGIDNRLIAFRARDGEEVSITPRGGNNGATAPINQVFNIQARDADSFRRSQTQLQNRALAGINQARRAR